MKNVPGNVMQERCEYILSHLQVNFSYLIYSLVMRFAFMSLISVKGVSKWGIGKESKLV